MVDPVTLDEIIRGYAVSAFRRVTNPVLLALIVGAGFRSMERFAEAVNHRGWHAYGLQLVYDHISVRRWLRGGVSRHPDIVAGVISDAWGFPVPVHVIWPELRDGAAPVPAHLQAWTTARTLEDLATLIGSEMLTRREILSGSIGVATGSALLAPMTRWLDVDPIGLTSLRLGAAAPADDPDRRIGDSDVAHIEDSIRLLAARDAQTGGGLSRGAALGQLKQATDLLRYGTYTDAVGNRLLAAVAGLAGLAGWMSLDSGMAGPSQQYLLYGLQAARESTDPRAPMLVVRLLADLAQHQRWTGEYRTAVRLHDLALDRLPPGDLGTTSTRAKIIADKAQTLGHLGVPCLPEVNNAVALSTDLCAQATEAAEDNDDAYPLAHRLMDVSAPELAAIAAQAYITLAEEEPTMAERAESHNRRAIGNFAKVYGRNRALTHIRLARLRFISGEPEEGCVEGQRALEAASGTVSTMVKSRLNGLFVDTERYAALPDVIEFRDQLQTAACGGGKPVDISG